MSIFSRSILILIAIFSLSLRGVCSDVNIVQPYEALVVATMGNLTDLQKKKLITALFFDATDQVSVKFEPRLAKKLLDEMPEESSSVLRDVVLLDIAQRLFVALPPDRKIWHYKCVELLRSVSLPDHENLPAIEALKKAVAVVNSVKSADGFAPRCITEGNVDAMGGGLGVLDARGYNVYSVIRFTCFGGPWKPDMYFSYPDIIVEGLHKAAPSSE